MSIKIRKHGTVTASFATAQEVAIDHANDSIKIGDGTNLIGTFPNVGGVRSLPVSVQEIAAGSGIATSANQTNGTQRSKVTDGTDNVEIATVGIEKALKVSVIASVGGGGGGTAATDSAAFTATATQFTPIGGHLDDTASDALAEGEMGAVRMTSARALHVAVQNSVAVTGTFWQATQPVSHVNLDAALSTLATQVTLAAMSAKLPAALGQTTMAASMSVTLASNQSNVPVSGTVAVTNTDIATIAGAVRAEDVASADAHTGIPAMAVRKLTPVNTSGTDGDYEMLQMSAGRLWVSATVDAALPAGANAIGKLAANSGVDIGDVDILSVTAAASTNKCDVGLINAVTPLMGNGVTGTGSLRVTVASDNTAYPIIANGGIAHGAVDSGSPVKTGGKVYTTSLTNEVAGDRADFICDSQGAQIVVANKPRGFVRTQTTAITTTTETTIVTAGGAGVLNDIVAMIITNNSTVDSLCTIKDATAGTTRFIFLVPKGGGIVFQPAMPLAQQAAANNNWTATMGTTATATNISVQYIINT